MIRRSLVRTAGRLPAAMLLGAFLLAVLPAPTVGHPLGNFTVNQYSRLEPGAGGVAVRYVLDMAEIPTFQELQRIDTDDDDVVSDAEKAAYLETQVPFLVSGLGLEVDGNAVPLEVLGQELSFPPGQGDLATLRLVLDLRAELEPGPEERSASYTVGNYTDRLGWREIIVREAPGGTLVESSAPVEDQTDELRTYPDALIETPVQSDSASLRFVIDEAAQPVASPSGPSPSPAGTGGGIVPPRGGAGDPLADLFGGEETPLAALLAIIVSVGLGGLHALSPGHGKTLVAAYLVGSRGQVRQAVLLGLTVAVTHTAGIFVLGMVTIVAGETFLAETVVEWLAVIAGGLVILLGGVLLARFLGLIGGGGLDHEHGSGPGQHTHGPSHAAPEPAATAMHEAIHEHPHGDDGHHAHDDHDHEAHGQDHDHGGHVQGHGHGHGGHVQERQLGHDHGPADGTGVIADRVRQPTQLTRGSAIALGLAGGLVPSVSALLVFLLGVAQDRLAFGIVLIVAFGVGMAVVLGGVGFVVVAARHSTRLASVGVLQRPLVRRLGAALPLLSGVAVLGTGIVVTIQALGRVM